MAFSVRSNGTIWDGSPGTEPPPGYTGAVQPKLTEGREDLLFINNPSAISTTVFGSFYLCMAGPHTLASDTDIVPGRNKSNDIFLFRNVDIAEKVVERKNFSNNAEGQELILRFTPENDPCSNLDFYSGALLRNTQYIDYDTCDVNDWSTGMYRFLFKEESDGTLKAAVEAKSTGWYTDANITVRYSDIRGKLIVTNCIVDVALGEGSASGAVGPCTSAFNFENTRTRLYLGGNTFQFRGQSINFVSRDTIVAFGNIFECPAFNCAHLFEMSGGLLYFHCNALSDAIDPNVNLVPTGINKEDYKNRYDENPIIDPLSYFPVEEEHTIHHHKEMVSVVDDGMEDITTIDRISFDEGLPLDQGHAFDTFRGVPFEMLEFLKVDIFEFQRAGHNRLGDIGAVCISYDFPDEEQVIVRTRNDLIRILQRYNNLPVYIDTDSDGIKDDVQLPQQLRHPLKLYIHADLEFGDVDIMEMYTGRHGFFLIQGEKTADGTYPIITTDLTVVGGNHNMELRNVKIDGHVFLRSTLLESNFRLSAAINKG
jgi:hypothetical protein